MDKKETRKKAKNLYALKTGVKAGGFTTMLAAAKNQGKN